MGLLDQVQGRTNEQRKLAAREYFSLLSRAENPKPGDAEKVAACLSTLGRDPSRLAEDIASVARVHARATAMGRIPELTAVAGDLRLKMKTATAELEARRVALYEENQRVCKANGDNWSQANAAVQAETIVANAGLRDERNWDAAFAGEPLPT